MRKPMMGLVAFAALAMFGSVGACGSDAGDPTTADGGPDEIDTDAAETSDDSTPLFVDGAAGDDENDGSRAKPLKTIGTAVEKTSSTGKTTIHVCGSGTYPEHLKLTGAVSIHGGFACTSWAASESAFPKVAPSDKGYALQVDHVRGTVTISNIELAAADVSDLKDGTSSIAVFVNEANVTFLNAMLTASNGATGAAGKAGGPGASTPTDLTGNSASGAKGGVSKVCTCSSSTTATKGGAGGSDGAGGGLGEPSYGASPPNNGSAGYPNYGSCIASTYGGHGADAPPAKNADATAMLGLLDPSGWHPGAGTDATENGRPGQGGGGGASYNSGTGASGGACGGCGGFAGKGGGGGGASIALLMNNSVVTLTNSSLFTRKGGAGGLGGEGGVGGAGGAPGFTGACPGGAGGRGADGGAGGGGAGGVSIGILYKGTPPSQDAATTIQVGDAGLGGQGGKSPDNDGPSSKPGKTKDAALL